MTAVRSTAIPEAQRQRWQRRWYFYDWANSAFVTTTMTVLMAPYLTSIAQRAACPGQDLAQDCRSHLSVLGLNISPGSLAPYTITVSTLMSAVVLIFIGAIADRTARPMALLAGFAWTGAASASAMFFVQGTNWGLGVVLIILGNLCLGGSLIVYDALLIRIAEPDERDRVSSRGWALGYFGGGLLLALNLALVTAHDALGVSTEMAVRLSLLSAGIWWAIFTIIPVRGLWQVRGTTAVPLQQRAGVVGGSLAQLRDTFGELRRLPHTWRFLLAYLFFNDGIQTVIVSASLYGQAELGFSDNQLIQTILLVQFVASGGALIFGRLAARYGAKRMILAGLVVWCAVVVIAFLLPAQAYLPWLLLGVVIGLVLGGTKALTRSIYSQLIPRGRESEFFSLYQAMERGTSWWGTLAFGLIYQFTGSYRPSILVLVVFFVLGGVLLARTDIRKGILDAGNRLPRIL